MNYAMIDEVIVRAFAEDFPYGDITTESLLSCDAQLEVLLIAKEKGIIAGLEVFRRVYTLLGNVDCRFLCRDGTEVCQGQEVAVITGNAINLLKGERTALNFIQRLSGIATITRKYVNALAGSKTKLLDTRKTTPGLRYLEKYAVTVGGAQNHRFGLSDGILIKDNHIAAVGSIHKAVAGVRSRFGIMRKIEVEVETLDMVDEALAAGADMIMLDNMSPEMMKKAVLAIGGRAVTECSGGIDLERLQQIRDIGVDFVSSGTLTHSYSSLDLSLRKDRGVYLPAEG